MIKQFRLRRSNLIKSSEVRRGVYLHRWVYLHFIKLMFDSTRIQRGEIIVSIFVTNIFYRVRYTLMGAFEGLFAQITKYNIYYLKGILFLKMRLFGIICVIMQIHV